MQTRPEVSWANCGMCAVESRDTSSCPALQEWSCEKKRRVLTFPRALYPEARLRQISTLEETFGESKFDADGLPDTVLLETSTLYVSFRNSTPVSPDRMMYLWTPRRTCRNSPTKPLGVSAFRSSGVSPSFGI